jgi:hypothetical protein
MYVYYRMSGAGGGGGKRGVSWRAEGIVSNVQYAHPNSAARKGNQTRNERREGERNVRLSKFYVEKNLVGRMGRVTLGDGSAKQYLGTFRGGRRKTRRRAKKNRKTRRNY